MGLFDIFKKKETYPYLYTEEEAAEYEKYIEEEFGEYTEVFHELVSPDIHLDVIIVPPTAESNYYKLITMGMGAYRMKIPRAWKELELERAELVLYLPPTWKIKSNKEEDYWPIKQLKSMARLPIQYNTWIAYGHTFSLDEDNTPYADNTKFCGMMLTNASNKNNQELNLKMKTIGKINFYQLFPLYKEELSFKNEHDADTLLELFDDIDKVPILNLDRKNYCMNQ